MPKNPATLTRSISWRYDVLAALDTKAETLRTERSTYVNGVMEHLLGLAPHPELVGRDVPYFPDRMKNWVGLAKGYEKAANGGREIKRLNTRAYVAAKKAGLGDWGKVAGGLVRRPGPRIVAGTAT